MDSIKKQQRNEAVDIFRVICAFLVIIGHTRPFMNINSNLDFFLTNILVRKKSKLLLMFIKGLVCPIITKNAQMTLNISTASFRCCFFILSIYIS